MQTTRQLIETGRVVGIQLLDHIIGGTTAPPPYVSLCRAGGFHPTRSGLTKPPHLNERGILQMEKNQTLNSRLMMLFATVVGCCVLLAGARAFHICGSGLPPALRKSCRCFRNRPGWRFNSLGNSYPGRTPPIGASGRRFLSRERRGDEPMTKGPGGWALKRNILALPAAPPTEEGVIPETYRRCLERIHQPAAGDGVSEFRSSRPRRCPSGLCPARPAPVPRRATAAASSVRPCRSSRWPDCAERRCGRIYSPPQQAFLFLPAPLCLPECPVDPGGRRPGIGLNGAW